eukprot:CAMPEP_0167755354 /NCGR_PEP_ID=MMETSP0110_2-20121227/8775_1 /TAXON_ID=629695 /ORGANISM="Gymnochlora sp., Strain CCMP2014" /LENGTH=158 /DNA_ID=CAMNT_0007641327 /DNA_START=289 /DNA_END=765 /DNA_ORIENTATION=-
MAEDGTFQVTIPGAFESQGESFINKFAGKHIEQYQYTSTRVPKFQILISEDPLPPQLTLNNLPSIDDLAERTIDIEKGKAYVDDVELLDADEQVVDGVNIRDISYLVTTARDEDRYFIRSVVENNKIYSMQVRVRERDFDRLSETINAALKSFKVKKD